MSLNEAGGGPSKYDGLKRPTDIETTKSTEMGEMHHIEKPFTVLTAMGIGYGVTNTACGVLLVLGSTLTMGGSPLLLWGFLFVAAIGAATAMSLSELASANPHPGGQYVWVEQLAPPKLRGFLSYVTAMASWFGAIATGASACLAVPTGLATIWTTNDPSFSYKPWMGFVGYQILNVLTLLAACFERILPKVSRMLLFFTVSSMVSIFITLFAMSPQRSSAWEAMGDIENISGWPNGVAILIALNGVNWGFSCLDLVVHISEEIPNPRINVPKALMWTVIVGFGSGLIIVLAVVVNIGKVDPTTDNSSMAILLKICGGNVAAASGLWSLPMISTIGAVWGIHTWQSRLAWALACQKGLPMNRLLRRIAPSPFHTPVWALVVSSIISSIFGCLYLASETAFNSLVSSGILLQYISYSIPIALLLRRGRSGFNHGPIWFPRLGYFANFIVLIWTSIALVFYCFPYAIPIDVAEMNYVSVVLSVVLILSVAMWFGYARKGFIVLESD